MSQLAEVKFEVTAKTILWAREKMVDLVEGILDDPFWGGPDNETAADHVDEYRAVARDLGLDFDLMILQYGSVSEVSRWHNLLKQKGKFLT